MTFKELEGAIQELFVGKKYITDIDYMYALEEDMDAEAYVDKLECMIDEESFIYYTSAMIFLSEEDPSLSESIEAAKEMGYSIHNLSSVMLADILRSSRAKNELSEMKDDIEEAFEKHEDWMEDQAISEL
jgi:hypothetical protein